MKSNLAKTLLIGIPLAFATTFGGLKAQENQTIKEEEHTTVKAPKESWERVNCASLQVSFEGQIGAGIGVSLNDNQTTWAQVSAFMNRSPLYTKEISKNTQTEQLENNRIYRKTTTQVEHYVPTWRLELIQKFGGFGVGIGAQFVGKQRSEQILEENMHRQTYAKEIISESDIKYGQTEFATVLPTISCSGDLGDKWTLTVSTTFDPKGKYSSTTTAGVAYRF